VVFDFTEGGTCAAFVDIPVGDTGAVVFSLVKAFAAVTLLASKAGFTPVAFTPVAFLAVVVAPFVVVGIMVFPIIVLLLDINPLFIVIVDDDVFVCCANTSHELLLTTNAKLMATAIAATKKVVDIKVASFIVQKIQ
jgi:hypothetical protein